MICSMLTKAIKSMCSAYKNDKSHVKGSLCPTEKQYGHLSQECLYCMEEHVF